MKTSKTIQTVDEYLLVLPGDVHPVLSELRKNIKAAAPGAEEVMSYQIPTYKHNGVLVHFAAFKNHCSLVTVNKNIIKTFERELKGFKTSGTTIQFTAANPIPAVLVKKIVKQRVKENRAL